MIETTYRLLGVEDDDTDPQLISAVEAVTGAWQTYGIDTPISVASILDTCGLQTAITAFYSSTTDNRELAKVAALAIVQAHLYTYALALPNDTRPFNLLYFLGLYLQGLGTVTTPRTDYCGDPLGASHAVTLAQIADYTSTIQAAINALDLVGTLPTYTLLVVNNGGPMTGDQYTSNLGNQIKSIQIGSPINDPSIQTPTGLDNYSPQAISSLAGNSDLFMHDNFQYSATSPVYYLAQVQYENPNIVPVNYTNQAAVELGTAALLAAQQVTDDVATLLSMICNHVKTAVDSYNAAQRQNLTPTIAYYQQLARGMPPTSTGNAQWDSVVKSVQDAGLNRRAALLRDQSYINQFDTNSDGILSASERVAAEKSIQAETVNARIAAATTAYNSVQSTYLSFTGNTDIINTILRTYLL